MRFLSTLLFSLAMMATSTSGASLPQLLGGSYIVDMTSVDVNTNITMASWRQYQQVNRDNNNIQTIIQTKLWNMMPYNQTISYEQAQLSGTGGSAQEGPIYTYIADSHAPTLTGPGRVWVSCSYSELAKRQPNYCTEVLEVPARNYPCGRQMDRTCTLSQVACRHNNVIMPAQYYMLDINNGEVVQQVDHVNATQVTYWSNLIQTPTSGQFGDAVLLPARGSCPDNNDKFPTVFGAQPVTPLHTTNAPPTTAPGTGNVPISSTGYIAFGAASSSMPALSTIVMILPAALTALLRF